MINYDKFRSIRICHLANFFRYQGHKIKVIEAALGLDDNTIMRRYSKAF